MMVRRGFAIEKTKGESPMRICCEKFGAHLRDLTNVLMLGVNGQRSLVPHVGCNVAPTPTPIASTWMNLGKDDLSGTGLND